jgi:hypothetical protein
MMAKKKQHGGARPGSGRKVAEAGRAVVIAVSVPGPIAEELDAYAQSKGWSRSKAVMQAIQGLLGKRKPVAKN